MPSLFLVMLGGRHARANTEVHDVVVATGESLEQVYPQLRQAWFGEAKGLHIDAWAQIQGVQFEDKNYQLQFKPTPVAQSAEKLYLINLGGYDPREFGELHRYVFVVAQNEMVAKVKGKQYFAAHWQKQHTDRVLEVDDCLHIGEVQGQYVHLIEGDFASNQWENCYLTL
ncbi:DUF1543 domain-containing protein [Acinetobacter rudis]|uniref:DUF1543 domain-containing protein n=1 Tax=Acinetobacter rudis TaxID=632955 RepID=UPI00333E5023